jgi:hypothetical protein
MLKDSQLKDYIGTTTLFRLPSSAVRLTALAVLFCALAGANPALAAAGDTTDQDQQGMSQSSAPAMTPSTVKGGHSSAAMAQHVETRIKTLHDKLKITSDEESKWDDVAQTMRENETNISQLVEERHQNAESMTAVDDLQSYAKITQAHADALKKLASSFQALYESMPGDQQKNADMVFGDFEGHKHNGKSGMKHS